MFDVHIVKNFLSADECSKLNNAAKKGIELGWLDKGKNRGKHEYKDRLTSRMHMQNHEYPQIVLDTLNKIRKFCKIEQYSIAEGKAKNYGKNGVIVSVTYNGGDTYEHNDPRSDCGLYATYKCNVLTQKPKNGGILFVNDKEILLEEGDLHCYFASEIKHYVTPSSGDTPRILWMFGSHVPLNDVKSTKQDNT
jgi:hypothetical protein